MISLAAAHILDVLPSRTTDRAADGAAIVTHLLSTIDETSAGSLRAATWRSRPTAARTTTRPTSGSHTSTTKPPQESGATSVSGHERPART
jgi:hypothetical protein